MEKSSKFRQFLKSYKNRQSMGHIFLNFRSQFDENSISRLTSHFSLGFFSHIYYFNEVVSAVNISTSIVANTVCVESLVIMVITITNRIIIWFNAIVALYNKSLILIKLKTVLIFNSRKLLKA